VSDQLLTFLKYIFLALLYLFFLRVLRAVWMELREPKPAGATPSAPAAAPAPSRRSRSRSRKPSPDAERLVILEPPDRQGQEFALGEELTVGRAGGCGVMIPDDTFVSQLHARVFRRDGDLYVEDLGSTNGTYLNNKKITAAVAMRKGDKLKIGKTTMEVRR
jgi:pSer/pThr/pTyr-binding forkhead associated (FHA) protein